MYHVCDNEVCVTEVILDIGTGGAEDVPHVLKLLCKLFYEVNCSY